MGKKYLTIAHILCIMFKGDNMSNFLVIDDFLFIRENANSQCLMELVRGLKKNGHNIYLMAREYDNSAFDDLNDVTICPVAMKLQSFVDSKLSYQNKNFVVKLIYRIISFILYHLDTFLLPKKMIRTGSKIIKEKNIDKIISIYYAKINHDSAFKLKKRHKGIEWIMYNLDQFSFDTRHSSLKKALYRHEEKKYSKEVDKIINVDGIEEEYVNNHFEPYKNIPKISVPLPNLKPDSANYMKQNNDAKMVMRYFGTFYEDIRNPDCLLRMLQELDSAQYRVEFYGRCCEYLKKHYDSLPECVHLSGTVSGEKCIELTDSADILINVGNTCVNQMPSKVFEYISSGKPILNIYFNDKELAMKYLRKYPCILNVRSDENISSSQLDDFCKKSRLIPAEEIKKIYNDSLSENVIQKSVEFIEE